MEPDDKWPISQTIGFIFWSSCLLWAAIFELCKIFTW